MNRLKVLAVALAGGIIGGLISRSLSPDPVLAQAPTASPTVELRAQRFVLLNQNGAVVATFTGELPSLPVGIVNPRPDISDSRPSVRILDPNGNEMWRVGGNPVRGLALK